MQVRGHALPPLRARDRREPLLQVVKTGVATAIAWELPRTLGLADVPVFSALAALLVVQVTVRRSIRGAVERVGAVVVGVLLAYAVAAAFGLQAWTVGVVVALGLLAARLVHLGPSGVQVPVTALLVLVVGGTQVGSAVDRVLETVLGALVGVAVNAAVVPPVRLRPAQQAVGRLGGELAALLAVLATGTATTWTQEQARTWLLQSRRLPGELATARQTVEDAEDSLRWNPRGRAAAARAARLREASTALEHVVLQTRGATRTLFDLPSGGSATLPEEFATLLAAAGRAVGAYTLAVTLDAVAGSPPAEGLAGAVAEARTRVALAVRAGGPLPVTSTGTQPGDDWLARGSLLADLRRLLRELDPAGPHAAALLRPDDDPARDRDRRRRRRHR